jgi:hypothetical protein
MNSSMTYTDPGAILGRAFLRIGQVMLVLFALASGYMVYLGSEGLFSDWEIEEDLLRLFPSLSPEDWITYFFVGLGLKCLFWFGILAWLERKI